MANEKLTVERISSYQSPSVPGGWGIIRLIDGSSFKLSSAERKFVFWESLINEVKNSGDPIAVEFQEESGKVTDLYWPVARAIQSISATPDPDRWNVVFVSAPSVYFLRASRPNFDDLRQRLERAAATKAELLITSNGDTLEVIDAREVPPPRRQ